MKNAEGYKFMKTDSSQKKDKGFSQGGWNREQEVPSHSGN